MNVSDAIFLSSLLDFLKLAIEGSKPIIEAFSASKDPEKRAMAAVNREEIELFEKYHNDYGYVFYVMRKL